MRPASAGLFSFGRVDRQLPVREFLCGPPFGQTARGQFGVEMVHDRFEEHGGGNAGVRGKALEAFLLSLLNLPTERDGIHARASGESTNCHRANVLGSATVNTLTRR